MYRAYKFKMYLTQIQEEKINKTFGCVRKVYNYFLSNNIKQSKITFDTVSAIKEYYSNVKKIYPYLSEVNNEVLINAIYRLKDAYAKCKLKGLTHPYFKSLFKRQSFSISSCNLDLVNKRVELSSFGTIKIRGYNELKRIDGTIIKATLSKETTGNYYISILVNAPDIKTVSNASSFVGVDLGIKNLVATSDGIVYINNNYISKYEKQIKRYQKALSRKNKYSKNYYKCKKKLSIIYTKLKNSRKNNTHNITKEIVNNHDVISMETLKVSHMLKAKHNSFNKKILDVSFLEIINQLIYKSKMYGKLYYQVDTYYPSSQICNVCGSINKDMKDLTKRRFECDNCGCHIDRDINSSINIMYEAIKKYQYNLN